VPRVVIVDDHELFRSGLARLISHCHSVVALASDRATTLRAIIEHDPDIILLDLHIPGMDTIGLIDELRTRFSRLRILVVTGSVEPKPLRSAIAKGVAGIVLKTSSSQTLREAIDRVSENKMFVDPNIKLADEPQEQPDTLTAREREIMVLLARGASYRDIGRELALAVRTIETHRRRIAAKLGLKTRAQLVAFAIANGYLSENVA